MTQARCALGDLSVGALVQIACPTGGCVPGAVYRVTDLPDGKRNYVQVQPLDDEWHRDYHRACTRPKMGFDPSSLTLAS